MLCSLPPFAQRASVSRLMAMLAAANISAASSARALLPRAGALEVDGRRGKKLAHRPAAVLAARGPRAVDAVHHLDLATADGAAVVVSGHVLRLPLSRPASACRTSGSRTHDRAGRRNRSGRTRGRRDRPPGRVAPAA